MCIRDSSQTILCNLSKFCVDWKLIGKHLGLTEAEITAVDGDNRTVDEKRVGMLEKWKGKFAFQANYQGLVEALLSIGKCTDAIEVCKMIGAAAAG